MSKKAKWGRVLIVLAFSLIVAGMGCGSRNNSKADSRITSSSFITRRDTDVTGHNVETRIDQIKLPLSASGTYDFVVDWGDGKTKRITSYNQADITHTYATPEEYEVVITGTCEGFGFDFDYDHLRVLETVQSCWM